MQHELQSQSYGVEEETDNHQRMEHYVDVEYLDDTQEESSITSKPEIVAELSQQDEARNDTGYYSGITYLAKSLNCFLTGQFCTGYIQAATIERQSQENAEAEDELRSSAEDLAILNIEYLYGPSEELAVTPEPHTSGNDYVNIEYLDGDISKQGNSGVIPNPEHEEPSRCTNCEKCHR